MIRKDKYANIEKFRKTANAQKKRYYGKTTDAKNKGEPWSEHEVERIMMRDVTDMELSAEIGRSVKAIQVMRSRARKRNNEEGQE